MGYLASASTIYARAYLTSRGREYLFNNGNIRFDQLGNDLFEIKTFTLGDPDINYNTTNLIPAGHIPDVSGKYENCLKTSLDYEQRNLLFYNNFDQFITTQIDYTTDASDNLLNVNVNLNSNDIPVGVDTALPSVNAQNGGAVLGPATPNNPGLVNTPGLVNSPGKTVPNTPKIIR